MNQSYNVLKNYFSKHLYKIFIFYIKNGTFKNCLQILIKLYTPKRTKLHRLKKSRGACPRTPLASRHANFQIRRKKILGPPCQILATPLGFIGEEFGTLKDYILRIKLPEEYSCIWINSEGLCSNDSVLIHNASVHIRRVTYVL